MVSLVPSNNFYNIYLKHITIRHVHNYIVDCHSVVVSFIV